MPLNTKKLILLNKNKGCFDYEAAFSFKKNLY